MIKVENTAYFYNFDSETYEKIKSNLLFEYFGRILGRTNLSCSWFIIELSCFHWIPHNLNLKFWYQLTQFLLGQIFQQNTNSKGRQILKGKPSLVISTTFEFPAKTKFKIPWIWCKIEKFFQRGKYFIPNLPTFLQN